jgi:hypothetical protein
MNLQELPPSGDSVTAANENFLELDWSTVYGKDPATTSGLTWGYHGTPSDGAQEGRWGGFEVAAGTFTLTDDAVNYIVAKRSDGVTTASTSTTNWDNTTDYARVYKVTTADGLVTAIEDHRAGPNGVLSGNNGSAVFTVVDGTGSPSVNLTNIDTLEFMGSAEVHNMGGGRALVNLTGGGAGAGLIQVAHAERTTVGTTSSTSIPFDDTIPQSGEGTEFLTCAITPTSATNKLRIDVTAFVAVNALSNAIAALFQDATANALAAGFVVIHASGYAYCIHFTHIMDAGTTSATTFKLRCGPSNSAHVLTINGSGGSRVFGGTMKSTITITEYEP